jgi:hypothetical protein
MSHDHGFDGCRIRVEAANCDGLIRFFVARKAGDQSQSRPQLGGIAVCRLRELDESFSFFGALEAFRQYGDVAFAAD